MSVIACQTTAIFIDTVTRKSTLSRVHWCASDHLGVRNMHDQVTRILNEAARRPEAADELLPLVYDQLRAIAEQRMRGERSGHTLQATALVHEACARMLGDDRAYESRAHFFRVAAEAMRRILIDHARKRGAEKRGGGRARVPISVVDLAEDHDPAQILALDEALKKLEGEDPRAFEIVQLRFFAGLSAEETAEVLGVAKRTVQREWAYARAKLYQLLGPDA